MSSASIPVGTRVELIEKKGYIGTVAFFGSTEFSDGVWVGVILDEAKGKNNGTVKGKSYFDCEDNYGLFVRPAQVKSVSSITPATKLPAASSSSGLRKPASSSLLKKPTSRTSMAGDSQKSTPAKKHRRVKSVSVTRGSPGMSPAISTEQLKQSASSSKLKQSQSREQLSGSSQQTTPEKKSKKKLVKDSGASSVATEKASSPPTLSPPPVKAMQLGADEDDQPNTPSVTSAVARFQKPSTTDDGILRDVPPDMSEGAQLEYLRAEVKDLREKLETLRMKRSEDKQKLIDYERCKIQLQQLIEFKNKMTEAHAELQRKLQAAEKETREAMEARDTHAEEMSGLAEAIEMATLDKEMAEEKCELMQTELDSCKERIQELEVDLEILKGEIESAAAGGDAGSENVGIQIKQLQTQNERLKEALVKMRDISEFASDEKARLLKESESMKTQLLALTQKTDKLSGLNHEYEQQITDLKEQVDAALGSEDMIEQLTTKNLALEEKVRELEESIEDFEQMKLIDDEMLENARDTERSLRQDIAMVESRCSELNLRLKEMHERINDYESTIGKFRARVAEQQEENQELKDEILRLQQSKSQTQSSDEDVINDNGGDPDSAALTTTGYYGIQGHKKLAQLVESDMTRLEHGVSQQHIKYLRAFLPDNFSKAGGDNDSILMLIVLERLIGKSQLLCRLLQMKFPGVPGGMRREHVVQSHKAEQWAFVARVNYLLHALITVLHKFTSILGKCTVERLARLAQLQTEMAAQERHLDLYFELLKNNRLDENTTLDSLHKMINYFQNIYSVHLTTETFDGVQYARDTVSQVIAGTRWANIGVHRLQAYQTDASDKNPLSTFLTDLANFSKETDAMALRIKNHIPADEDPNCAVTLKFPEAVQTQVQEMLMAIERAAHALHASCAAASTQVNMMPDVDGLPSDRLEEMLQAGGEQVLGKIGSNEPLQLMRTTYGSATVSIGKLADAMDKAEFEVPKPPKDKEKTSFPPLLERAHTRKQDAVEAESLRWQLEKKEAEILEVKKQMRVRHDEISELKVRLEMAEKRLTTSGKEGDNRVVDMKNRVEQLQGDLKKQEQKYEQALEALSKELESAEKENADLKERLKSYSKKALLQGIIRGGGFMSAPIPGISREAGLMSTPTTPSVTHMPTIGAGDSPLLVKEIEKLRAALHVSETERWRVAGEQMAKDLRSLRPLKVPNRGASMGGLLDLDKSTNMQHNALTQLMRDTNKFTNQYIDFVARNKVIDISKRKAGHWPVTESATPAAQLARQVADAQQMQQSLQQLSARMHKYRAQQLAGCHAITDFASHVSTYTPQQLDASSVCVARIHVPCAPNDEHAGKVVPVPVTPEQLAFIHRKMTTV